MIVSSWIPPTYSPEASTHSTDCSLPPVSNPTESPTAIEPTTEEPEIPDNPYSVIQTTQASLTKNNSTASVSGTINAAAGTSKVTIKLELQVKSGSVYSTVKTWTKTAQSNYAKQTGSYSINSSKTYRLKATFTATKNGSTETATVYKY